MKKFKYFIIAFCLLGSQGLTWAMEQGTPVVQEETSIQADKVNEEKAFFDAIQMDYLALSKLKAYVNGTSYPLYQLGSTNYISFSTLEQLGFDIQNNGHEIVIKNPFSLLASNNYQEKPINQEKVKINNIPVKVGNLQSYGLAVSNEGYIPVRAMNEYFQIDIIEEVCALTKRENYTDQYVKVEENVITNTSDLPVSMAITNYFWNGKKIEETALVVDALAPGESYSLATYTDMENPKMIHYSTVIHDMKVVEGDIEKEERNIVQNNPMHYGQNDYQLFEQYEKNKVYQAEGYLDALFPATSIIGTMKYDTKGLKKGEKLQVWGAEDGSCYYVMKEGKKITIPWGSISIPTNPKVQKERAKKEDIEAFINKQNIQSRTKYLVWTDLYRQLTYVMEKQNNKWVLIRTMLCTTGNNKTPTPPGEFELKAYVPYFGVEKGYRCKNAVQIFGDYLYHSVMFDVKGNYVLGGQVLGEQGSHGCIRLSPQDSEWFYKTMPLKTKVIIR